MTLQDSNVMELDNNVMELLKANDLEDEIESLVSSGITYEQLQNMTFLKELINGSASRTRPDLTVKWSKGDDESTRGSLGRRPKTS